MPKDKNKAESITNHSLTTPDGDLKVDTLLQDETIWLTQSTMAELFDVKIPAVSRHLKNIFESGELDEKAVVSILEHTTLHGAIEGKTQTKQVKYYNFGQTLFNFCSKFYFCRANCQFAPHRACIRHSIQTN